MLKMEKIEREIKRYNKLIIELKDLKKQFSYQAVKKLNCKKFKSEIKDIISSLKYSRNYIIFYSKNNNCAVELIDITYFKGKKFYN
jgi:predicted ATP-grasp superfamily ATP-dependent carboligase